MPNVQFDSNRQSVRAIADQYRQKLLNLEPVFQRQSVWRRSQREKLLDSVLHGYPIPSVFLYRHVDEATGRMVFEVIDGKQRLETLFMYMGLKRRPANERNRLLAPIQVSEKDAQQFIAWKELCKLKLQHRIEEYLLQVTEVTAGLDDIIELFVRINSTGNALKNQEIRNAKFYRSEFLKSARKLAARYENYLQDIGVIGAQQVRRMKHIELMGELLVSANIGGVANKKRVLDTAMQKDGLKGAPLRKAEQMTLTALNRLRRMFPDLSRSVRYHKISDFYSLAVVLQTLEAKGYVLDNRRRNSLAWELLVALSVGVDDLALRSKRLDFRSLSPREELFRQYLQAVKEGSDSELNRKKRHDILVGIMEPLFQRKDANRLFSSEQRRILWNTAAQRVCAECARELTWADFHADHIKPFALGGRTQLDNARAPLRFVRFEEG